MKNIVIAFIATTFCANLWAQTQTYNGNYNLPVDNIKGTAQYDYKEVDDERVRHGKFVFKSSTSHRESVSIIGNYKEGLRDGHWKSVSKGAPGGSFIVAQKRSNKQVFLETGVTSTMEGNYKNGVRDGAWTFTRNGTDIKYSSKASFNNGTFYGDFTATAQATLNKRGDWQRKFSLKGRFSEGGFPDSLWVGKWMNEEGIEFLLKMTFDKGCFVSLKVKDQSTGEDVSNEFSNYSYIAGKYKSDGKMIDWTNSLPPIFRQMISDWLWDETLLTAEHEQESNKRQMKCFYLDWSGVSN